MLIKNVKNEYGRHQRLKGYFHFLRTSNFVSQLKVVKLTHIICKIWDLSFDILTK